MAQDSADMLLSIHRKHCFPCLERMAGETLERQSWLGKAEGGVCDEGSSDWAWSPGEAMHDTNACTPERQAEKVADAVCWAAVTTCLICA